MYRVGLTSGFGWSWLWRDEALERGMVWGQMESSSAGLHFLRTIMSPAQSWDENGECLRRQYEISTQRSGKGN